MLTLRPYMTAVAGRRTPQIWFLSFISLLCVSVMSVLLVPCYTNSNLLQQDSNYMTPILTETQMENIQHEMKRRQLTMMGQCHNTSSSKVNSIHQMPKILKVAKKLFVEKEHKLVWCPIYKAGSTTWMEIFATIGGVMTPNNRMRLSKGLIQINQLARMVYPKAKDTKATLKLLPETTRFIIVRHPFERILSAYRDKLEHRKDREFYYRRYGRHIVRLQRDGNATFADRAEPTFMEFLQYLVKTKNFDEHWSPFTVECAPCELNYQFILKMESLEKEQLFLAIKTNLLDFLLTVNSTDQLLQNTNPNGRTEQKYAQQYYGQVPKQLLQKVYVVYEDDFRLFDYSPNEYFSFAKGYRVQSVHGSLTMINGR
ncbi:Carbohydrate sulfotransferase 11 [Zootermopsis nevadensis]|uniref:Carbohydrate sulfotransferase n=1 Tax=Zootermopsis nevadensis TaxID=136037 RepID=A0A067RG43_ZOONE|nr:Carbohydrate sulfotransferase 11 [Zootermopsis nevadensis]